MAELSQPAAGGLSRLNSLPATQLTRELLACCAAPEWAEQLVVGRPYADVDALCRASEAALAVLDWSQVRRALDAHPRIGERPGGTGREARWSRGEQSAAATPDEAVQAELVAGNVAYEQRFGHVFLICATGRSATEILTALRARLRNDPPTEQGVVRVELGRIADLRLRKLVTA